MAGLFVVIKYMARTVKRSLISDRLPDFIKFNRI